MLRFAGRTHSPRTIPLISDLAQAAHSEPEGDALASPALSAPVEAGDALALQDLLTARLDDDQAIDVVVIDMAGKSPIADAIVIASGRSARHVSSMADHLLRALKDGGHGRAQVEGLPQADWVLIDAGDVIVHLFRPEVRSFYNIEKIWSVDSPGHLTGHDTFTPV